MGGPRGHDNVALKKANLLYRQQSKLAAFCEELRWVLLKQTKDGQRKKSKPVYLLSLGKAVPGYSNPESSHGNGINRDGLVQSTFWCGTALICETRFNAGLSSWQFHCWALSPDETQLLGTSTWMNTAHHAVNDCMALFTNAVVSQSKQPSLASDSDDDAASLGSSAPKLPKNDNRSNIRLFMHFEDQPDYAACDQLAKQPQPQPKRRGRPSKARANSLKRARSSEMEEEDFSCSSTPSSPLSEQEEELLVEAIAAASLQPLHLVQVEEEAEEGLADAGSLFQEEDPLFSLLFPPSSLIYADL